MFEAACIAATIEMESPQTDALGWRGLGVESVSAAQI